MNSPRRTPDQHTPASAGTTARRRPVRPPSPDHPRDTSAGSTPRSAPGRPRYRDHPRVRGEYYAGLLCSHQARGYPGRLKRFAMIEQMFETAIMVARGSAVGPRRRIRPDAPRNCRTSRSCRVAFHRPFHPGQSIMTLRPVDGVVTLGDGGCCHRSGEAQRGRRR